MSLLATIATTEAPRLAATTAATIALAAALPLLEVIGMFLIPFLSCCAQPYLARSDLYFSSSAPAKEEPRDRDDDGAVNPGSNLFVTGIHPRLTDDEVTRLFSKYGTVEKCQIMRDPHTKESRGFGFVKMVTSEEADAAKEGLQGKEYEGRTLSIDKARRARPRTPTPGKYFGPPSKSPCDTRPQFYSPILTCLQQRKLEVALTVTVTAEIVAEEAAAMAVATAVLAEVIATATATVTATTAAAAPVATVVVAATAATMTTTVATTVAMIVVATATTVVATIAEAAAVTTTTEVALIDMQVVAAAVMTATAALVEVVLAVAVSTDTSVALTALLAAMLLLPPAATVMPALAPMLETPTAVCTILTPVTVVTELFRCSLSKPRPSREHNQGAHGRLLASPAVFVSSTASVYFVNGIGIGRTSKSLRTRSLSARHTSS